MKETGPIVLEEGGSCVAAKSKAAKTVEDDQYGALARPRAHGAGQPHHDGGARSGRRMDRRPIPQPRPAARRRRGWRAAGGIGKPFVISIALFPAIDESVPKQKAADSGGLDRVCLQDQSAGRAPAAPPSAHSGVKRSAPATHDWPARGLFDWREVLGRCPQTERPTRGLGIRRQRAGRHNGYRRRKGNHQLTHRLSPRVCRSSKTIAKPSHGETAF